MSTIEDILKAYKVKTFKNVADNLIAIRKGGFWFYFQWTPAGYEQTGSTIHYEKD